MRTNPHVLLAAVAALCLLVYASLGLHKEQDGVTVDAGYKRARYGTLVAGGCAAVLSIASYAHAK